MIHPCLTYLDMRQAMEELETIFGLQVHWLGDAAAEIRWGSGVAIAQRDDPDALHGSHVGRSWIYVLVDDPDEHYARAVKAGGQALNEPHSTPDGRQRGYSARDREGNLWTFAIHDFRSTPDQGLER